MRLLEPAWKTRKSPAAAPAIVANKEPAGRSSAQTDPF
jgi:hypothetical protein